MGLVQGEPAWWWNDVVEVVMELGSWHGRAGQGLCVVLGWQCGRACAWQTGVVKESQSRGLRLWCGAAGLVRHVGEVLWWVGGGGALRVMLR